jgi:ketosteroid isomerase-like protein
MPRNLEPLNLVAKQASIPSSVKYVDKNLLWEDPTMKTKVKKRVKGAPRKLARTARKSVKTSNAAIIIRQMGDEWAKHWNAGALDNLVAAYASDAVYLPPHHEAIHGRDAIREYLRGPLSHGVSDLAFDVTYIKQYGNVALGRGRLPGERAPQRRNEKGRSRQVPHSLEACRCKVADRCGRLVQRPASVTLILS